MKNVNFMQILLVLLAMLPVQLDAQMWGRNPVVSPKINEDNSITFRLYAPDAKSVSISGNWMEGWGTRVELTRNDTGLYELTVGPLPSEMYSYSYFVDGVKTLDPSNVKVLRDGTRYENYVFAPGDRADMYSVMEIPHGTVSKVWYDSPTLNKKRRLYVYTPPGYDGSGKKYPVFYLLHGAGGDEDAWTTMGRTPWIMDNLIASGKAEPMIVVMTNGNAWSSAAPGEEPVSEAAPDYSNMVRGAFELSLVNDVIPFIEKNYRTISDRDHRAIAGLSMGGMHTQNITNANPGTFAYVGVMSMGIMNNPRWGNYDEEAHKAQIQALIDNNLKLYWIGCGESDFLIESVKNLRKFYDEAGLTYEYLETPGGHTWANWRIYLTVLAPRLFK